MRAVTSVAVAAVVIVASACAADPPAAVVGIVVDSCDPGQEVGSGMVVGPGLVLTSAHVLAGAQGIEVEREGVRSPATIVGFDPEMDLAYVSFAGPHPPAVPIGTRDSIGPDQRAVAYVVRRGEVVSLPITIRRTVQIRTEDIYIEGETLRPGLDLIGDIRAGDSGGAVLVDGKIVGVIWARSTAGARRAYAIDPDRGGELIRRQLAEGRLGDDVDIERCH